MGAQVGIQGLFSHRLLATAAPSPLWLRCYEDLQALDNALVDPGRERHAPDLRFVRLRIQFECQPFP